MSENDLDPARIKRARDAFHSVPYARFLGLELGEIEPGEVTIHLTIHYLRPITSGRLTATARIVRAGRRLFVLSVEVTNAGILVATAVTSYLKMV